ncbi:MAG: ABC transporter permease [Cytophagales bacterium]|nr:ABC transporter permease [Cytophagales bacterium]
MHKIFLVIQREYLARVRKKSFIIMTLIGPLLISLTWMLPVLLSMKGKEKKEILVLDDSGYFINQLQNSEELTFRYENIPAEQAKKKMKDKQFDAVLKIPKIDINNPTGIEILSNNTPSVSLVGGIENRIESVIENLRYEQMGLNKEAIQQLSPKVSIATMKLDENKETKSNAWVSFGISYISGFMIYMFIFMYGVQIMRGVMEEKQSRIVEILISSIKPFELMLGKIIGVAAVVFTQFSAWIALSAVLSLFAPILLAQFGIEMPDTSNPAAIQNNEGLEILSALQAFDANTLIIGFLLFFLGGYLMYSALFATVGSAIDHETDAQQFMMPISLPLIISLISLGAVLSDPHGPVAFWMSMIPLTSPVVMVARMAFGVPLWEVTLSFALLCLAFIAATWFAGRVYRIGILMHGSKVSYKTLWKWARMSQ